MIYITLLAIVVFMLVYLICELLRFRNNKLKSK